ncbi:MAG: hypothetical protein A2787_01230 [Omnitrophica WOR_2 bacterium RIFCSPHIGHO2_01_FULL_48_9]|nr:MAG: hypothetical protein A2787_01230 [Omnitrophica WOR_2 bacterium RIFCSPHIGHO2_01_FULL_48_9]
MGEKVSYKWLPVVEEGFCNGCQECVLACEPQCLAIQNGAVVLTHPDRCGSEEHCIAPCPIGVIKMDWVEYTGNQSIGKWRSSCRGEKNNACCCQCQHKELV